MDKPQKPADKPKNIPVEEPVPAPQDNPSRKEPLYAVDAGE